ncbi:MAG TPA: trypsin-like peptidase domain-containing protein [bacterium]|nr:trypsin-like peptidase domain-containing protein [bacterium]
MLKPKYQLITILIILSAIIPNITKASVTQADALAEQKATISAIKKNLSAVVSIIVSETVTVEKDGQKITQKVKRGSGTGFVISSDGLILTNRHVVNQAISDSGEYRIRFQSGKSYYAQLIGKDPLNDLAILKIFDKNLPTVQLGDSSKLAMGTTVIAIGNSLGRYQNSATKGIVSAIGRNLSASDDDGNSESLTNVIQTDAQINPGNSGGPLIDLDGKVIGINVARDNSGDSIGFAIPINDARTVIDSVKKTGRIIRPRLGVSYIMIDEDLAQEKNLPATEGALIADSENTGAIISNSPASQAGLMAGDIILEINAQKLTNQNSLLQVAQKYQPGQTIGLRVLRDNKIIVIKVTLDEFPNQ